MNNRQDEADWPRDVLQRKPHSDSSWISLRKGWDILLRDGSFPDTRRSAISLNLQLLSAWCSSWRSSSSTLFTSCPHWDCLRFPLSCFWSHMPACFRPEKWTSCSTEKRLQAYRSIMKTSETKNRKNRFSRPFNPYSKKRRAVHHGQYNLGRLNGDRSGVCAFQRNGSGS